MSRRNNQKKTDRREKMERKRRLIAGVIAIILALLMIITLVLPAMAAENTDSAGQAGADTLNAVAVSSSSAENSVQTEAVSSSSSASESQMVSSGSGSQKKYGIYIDNINVTDMTRSQMKKAVEARMKELSDDVIVLYAGDNEVRTTAGALGLTYTNQEVIEEALSIGKKGNIFKRFLADRQLENDGPIVLDLNFAVSRSDVSAVLAKNADALNCSPQSNGVVLNADNTFTLTPGKTGVALNNKASVQKIMDYFTSDWHGGEGGIMLSYSTTEYADQSAELSKITDLLGSATTGYQTGDTNHDTNVRLAAEHINGTVLYPGEEFSAEKVIGPTSKEYGFLPGDTYENGKVVESYGGGVCQTTTTLYDAVLAAELKVTERHNHSYLVSYVEPGFDASISEGLMDFCFENNTSAPIYIQAVTKNGYLTFNIYGEETRDSDRTVSFESRTLSTTDVETTYETDSSMPYGSITVSGGIQGVEAELYKEIYIGGQLDSEELVNRSSYAMMPLTYTIGTENADSETLQAIQAAIATGDLATIQTAVGNGSVVESDVIEN
jgi:vancomycin resistance protein YoaR